VFSASLPPSIRSSDDTPQSTKMESRPIRDRTANTYGMKERMSPVRFGRSNRCSV